MKRKFVSLSFLLLFAVGGVASLLGQTPTGAVKPSVVAGDVVSADGTKLVLQTKDGSIDALFSPTTEFKKVPPDNPKLSAAVAAAQSDIGQGDKVAVSGFYSEDRKSINVRTVYLMTKADITARNTSETQKWTTRGISGRVASVDQMTKQVKVEVRGLGGSTTTVVLTPKENAKFLRYAPNSVKFSEAVPSSVVEVQPGDMLRAVGDRSQDGASFAAEEVITGAFKTVAGTVKSVDAAKNEVVITDAASKKDVTVELGTAILLKKFPEEMAQRMAAFQGGGGGPQGGGAPGGQARPVQGPPAGAGVGPGGGPGRGFGGGGGRGIDDMLERFPTITVAELKPGDVIAISSSREQATAERVKAIKLLAGVEPFLRAAQAQAAASGQRGGGVSLSIPGLDGFGNP